MTTLEHPSTIDSNLEDVGLWRLAGLICDMPTRRGDMTCFRHDTGALTRSLHAYGEWAEHEIGFCSRFLKPGDTVLDVGAYIGTHTLAFAAAVSPTGRVYSFEAQPSSFALLAYNVEAHSLSHVTPANAIVSCPGSGDVMMIDEIDIAASRSFGSAIVDEKPGTNGRCPVPVTTLDSLGLADCALMKLDVEGMEDQVLLGAGNLLSDFAPLVFAECNAVDAGSRVVSCLRAHGYEVWMYLADAYNPGNWRANEVNIFGNSKEAALVGVPARHRVLCQTMKLTEHERLFRIKTLDDLVAGMLLKPQYPREVLQFATAVQGGRG